MENRVPLRTVTKTAQARLLRGQGPSSLWLLALPHAAKVGSWLSWVSVLPPGYSAGEKRNSCLDLLARYTARSFDISELQKHRKERSGSPVEDGLRLREGKTVPKPREWPIHAF